MRTARMPKPQNPCPASHFSQFDKVLWAAAWWGKGYSWVNLPSLTFPCSAICWCLLGRLSASRVIWASTNFPPGWVLTTIRESCLQTSSTAGWVSQFGLFNFHLRGTRVKVWPPCSVHSTHLKLLMQWPPLWDVLKNRILEFDDNYWKWVPKKIKQKFAC